MICIQNIKKKMNKLILLLIVVTSSLSLNAQDTYSLEQCIQYALENHSSIKKAEYDSEIATAKIKETISLGLPQINGKVDLLKNLNIQKQFLPANAFNPLAPADLVVPVAFGVDYSANANVQLNQLIFDGSYFVGLQAAKEVKAFADIGVEQSKEQVVYNVTTAYYGAIVNKERANLLHINLAQLDSLLKESEIMYENGLLEKIAIQQIGVNINNLKVQINRVDNVKKLSEALLKVYMGISPNEDINLEGSVNDFIQKLDTELSDQTRIEEKLLSQKKLLQELNLKNNKVAAYPKLYGFGSLGWNRGDNKFNQITKINSWERYSMIGLSLDIPIFSSFRRSHVLQQNKLEIKKTEADLSLLKQQVELDIVNATVSLDNAKNAMKIQQETMSLAKEILRVTEIKYKEGIASHFDLVQSETALQEAQTNYYLAVYEGLSAYVNYTKATGNLTK